MIVKLENYNGKYKIVSLALSQAAKEDLLKDNLDFIYISDNDIRLYPEEITRRMRLLIWPQVRQSRQVFRHPMFCTMT